MRILVTGGAGFIGSHLIDRLMAEGNDVICLDNFFTGRKRNILKWIGNPYFELIRHDITEPIRLEVDQIYHLACPASPIHYQYNPVKTIKTNVMGTLNMLGLAKRVKARFLLASTSEVYGDPEIHPQTEEYRGNVNPIGPRSCYDEGKRVAETLAFDYNLQNNVEIRVARIFNSLTGDQKVIYYKGDRLYYETFEECYHRIHQDISDVSVPCFNPENGEMALKPIAAIWKHKVTKKGYEIGTTWGKKVKITEDHSLFTRDENGLPQAVFGNQLKVGDDVAVPNYIPFIDRPLEPFYITDKLEKDGLAIASEDTISYLEQYRNKIHQYLAEKGVDNRQYFSQIRKYEAANRMPLELWQYLGLPISGKEKVVAYKSSKPIENYIENINNFLWFLGFYLAEGCLVDNQKGYQLLFSSNVKYLEKLVKIAKDIFGYECEIRFDKEEKRAPSVSISSKLIVDLVVNALGFGKNLSTQKDIPDWILQLPQKQLVQFLQGFWEGDGNHDAKTTGSLLIFNSSSQKIIEKLVLILAKFGIVGSVSEFYTTVRKGDTKQYKSYRITVQGLDDYSILNLGNVKQTLQAKTTGDLAWAKVKNIEAFDIDEDVYDFSVPEGENFIGGTYSICCHNTYGPRMLENDGRVVSNFIVQSLRGESITVYGDGSQTRSFCYVSDLVDGLIRLMNGSHRGPINLGNPDEYTILQLAQAVQLMVNPDAEIIFKPLPQDDPRRRQPDITKAKTWLGWQPTIPLQEGLKLTVADFRDRAAGTESHRQE
ncbi:MAG TPA: hypothetical protein DEA78_20655 [Cyanobacteria bacterium UBA11159]|nr:hypothetical protein [Cyanobacteria bacterium UBA11367]HBE60078.1 hypothetical protein [Cyanobacteria bacterium UBA11366]HBK64455.1 hypothetical protein [Cyanobacteria bacterium UBA11166]HBR76043.1 hypothetical protein [Cyanobacteria bacterium UBA11159]HBS69797.1 hypothetical protein [Cyanobacteria bacterium UBA11153]HCA97283.1 hypothetical protein [Cyanobacteria bacterium UBA9226]